MREKQTEQLQDIMATIMEARGELIREDALLIDVSPEREVIEVEAVEVEPELEAVEAAFPY